MKKPSRTDLLGAVMSLQGFIGKAMSVNNDRNPNRKAMVDDYLQRGHELCIEVRAADKPEAGLRSRFANRDTKSTAQ